MRGTTYTQTPPIAHTFIWSEWFVGMNKVGDVVWDERRDIQPWRWYSFDGINDYVQIWDLNGYFRDNASIIIQLKLDLATPWVASQTWIFNISDIAGVSHYPFTNWLAYFSAFKTTRVDNVSLSPLINRTQRHWLIITSQPWANGWRLYQNDILVHTDLWEVWPASVWWRRFPALSNIWWNSSSWNYFLWDMWSVSLYSRTLTIWEIRNIVRKNRLPRQSLQVMLKMDEGSWTVAYDSSLNMDHWSMVNWTSHVTFTDWWWSDFQNWYWYTNNWWVLIPRNEAIPTQDVQWNPLQFSWRAKYDWLLTWRYYTFDWTDDYVDITPSSFFSLWNWDVTFTTWIRVDPSNSALRAIFSIWYNITASWIGFYVNSSWSLFLTRWQPWWYTVLANWSSVLTQWQRHHVWFKRESNVFYLYVDWVEFTWITSSLWLWSATSEVNIGKIWTNSFYWFGDMHSIQFYKRALSLAEIQDIRTNDAINNVDMMYKFDEWLWTTAFDSSWNGRDWILVNGVQHNLWPWVWSSAFIRLWYTDSSWVAIPRDESNTSLDVQWNPLQYTNRGYDLLPWWEVDFNPWISAELIRENADKNYQYWDDQNSKNAKITQTDKELNFTIKPF